MVLRRKSGSRLAAELTRTAALLLLSKSDVLGSILAKMERETRTLNTFLEAGEMFKMTKAGHWVCLGFGFMGLRLLGVRMPLATGSLVWLRSLIEILDLHLGDVTD